MLVSGHYFIFPSLITFFPFLSFPFFVSYFALPFSSFPLFLSSYFQDSRRRWRKNCKLFTISANCSFKISKTGWRSPLTGEVLGLLKRDDDSAFTLKWWMVKELVDPLNEIAVNMLFVHSINLSLLVALSPKKGIYGVNWPTAELRIIDSSCMSYNAGRVVQGITISLS